MAGHKPRRERGKPKKQMGTDEVGGMLKKPLYGRVVRRSVDGESEIEGDIRLRDGASLEVTPCRGLAYPAPRPFP